MPPKDRNAFIICGTIKDNGKPCTHTQNIHTDQTGECRALGCNCPTFKEKK